MKFSRINRRRFIAATILSSPFLALADAKWLEPDWVKVRRVRLGPNDRRPTHRLVHFTDVHHKGDRTYLAGVVKKINALSPDLVLFTGDLIEETRHLTEALELFSGIKSPLYGVPGNHDYWSKAPFEPITKVFAATGGGWLLDQQIMSQDKAFSIIGATCLDARRTSIRTEPAPRNIFLMHYPAWVDNLTGSKFDLILAGHSHGGQVRVPFYGPLLLPYGVGRYDMGLFHTPAGPLYVNPGIGWFPVPLRFNCRPEITVFEI